MPLPFANGKTLDELLCLFESWSFFLSRIKIQIAPTTSNWIICGTRIEIQHIKNSTSVCNTVNVLKYCLLVIRKMVVIVVVVVVVVMVVTVTVITLLH